MKPEIVKKLRKLVRQLLEDRKHYLYKYREAQQKLIECEAQVCHLKEQLAPFGHVRIDPDVYNLDKVRRLTIMYDLRVVEQKGSGALYEYLVNKVRHQLLSDLKL